MIIDFLYSLSKMLPGIKAPASPPQIKEKIIWTIAALFLFFVMYNIMIFGADRQVSAFDFLQVITASKVGSLLTTGIGPIVLASIFLQLFVGAKILNIDMKNPNDKKKFHEAQPPLFNY